MKLPKFDATKFNNEPFIYQLDKPWGYEIHWTPPEKPYCGKILHVDAGKRMSLQIHDAKHETWLLLDGRAKVIWENNKGELVETELQPQLGYSCDLGQRHRLVGITDCDILEVSTPELGTTYRLEDDYAREHETERTRKRERS